MRLPWQKKTEPATSEPLMIAAPSDSQGMDVPRIEVGCTYPTMYGTYTAMATVTRLVQLRGRITVYYDSVATSRTAGPLVFLDRSDSLNTFVEDILRRIAYDHSTLLSVVIPTNLLKGL